MVMPAYKLSSYLILLFGASLWLASTVTACVYSKNEFQEATKNGARDIMLRIQNHLDAYQDLVTNFYALHESSDFVNQTEAERFFKSWKDHHYSKNKKEGVIFYGWYSLQNTQRDRFYNIANAGQTIEISFKDYAGKDLHPSKDKDFDIQQNAPYLDVKKFNKFNDLVLSRRYEQDKHPLRKGYIFFGIDKAVIENEIRSLYLKDNRKFLFSLLWNASGGKNVQEAETTYIHRLIFGDVNIELRLKSLNGWNVLGPENTIGMLAGIFGFSIVLLLFLYFRAVSQKSVSFELAKEAAERALGEQTNFYENIVQNLPGILFVKDVKNGFQYHMFNKEAEKFFGFPSEAMIGKFDKDYYKEEEADFFRAMDEATMNGHKVIDIPCEVVTTPSGEKFLHTRKVPIYDADGDPQYLVGLSEDITQRKKNELELGEYRQNLERMVDERTERLKIATTRAEEANRLKSEFLATMSHEIRSPMSGVLGMAELLLDTPLTLEQKGLTRTILNSGEVLLNIIEDILDFSKIEANKLELDPVAVNMLELVDDVCILYSSRARDKALELVVYYTPGSEQFVYADPVRMRQVLGNLLNNAIKFTQTGYIVITVREEKNEFLPEDKVRLTFSVEDTGIGIEESDMDRIFEKFSQVNSSTTRNYGGTGLGLSICRKLVEMMGGKILVTSAVGKGSKFEFSLPMTRNREEIFAYPFPTALKETRMLIVDDLPIICTMLSEQLSMAGIRCDTASSGHEALIKLMEAKHKNIQYDMIIIDYLMPGMNGEMLARAINDEPDFRNICLVMLTAAGNPLIGDDFAEKGFSAYISKPVRMLDLIDTLAVVWGKYKAGFTDTLIRVDVAGMGGQRGGGDFIRLEGSRILLVEDSRLNQAFAEEVLSQLACDVVTVSNGQEAIDMLAARAFDLVLMDCQMPVMDGFEASRRIMQMKQDGIVSKDLPIIALTANAMKGDRQRCLEAGMNDYISKPVRKKELKEKIYYWIKHEDISTHGQAEEKELAAPHKTDPSERAPLEILDATMFEEAKSLLKDKFDFLLGCYIDDIELYMREIQDAVSNRNIEGIVRPAHTIKSTSKRMGAMRLSDIARDIELAAREAANSNEDQGVHPEILDRIRQMSSIFEQTKQTLTGSSASRSA